MEVKPILKKIEELFPFAGNFEIPFFEERGPLVPEVDEAYIFNPEITLAILAGFRWNKRVLLQGFHGTGKSTHLEQVCARLNWPTFRVNLDGYISRIELVGRDAIVLKNEKQITEFQDGIIPYSIKRPMALILDEYDAARPDVMFTLQRLLEGEGKFSLIEKNIVLEVNPYFRIFATSNTLGQGDDTGLYHGTQFINQGQLDRFNIIAKLDYLSEHDEVAIVKSRIPKIEEDSNLKLAENMVMLANLTRQAFINGDISNLMSPRTVISWAENYLIFANLDLSFYYSFLNKCDISEHPIIAEFYQRIFNRELSPSLAK